MKLVESEKVSLTPQELLILQNIANGARPTDIAQSCRIEITTIKTHLRNAFLKLYANHRAHAVAIALRHKLFLGVQESQFPTKKLTEIELEILQYIANGLKSREIVEQHHIAHGTVKTHLQNIFGKLNANHQAHAVAIVLQKGLIQ